MAFDGHANFAYSTVLTAPSPATTGTTVVLQSGDGAKFPAAPFNVSIWPAGANPLTTNAEVARCTAKATDTLTIVRAQEGSTARTVVAGDQIAATITTKTLTDLEASRYKGAWTLTAYAVGDMVTYQDKLYVCTTTVPGSGSFVGAQATGAATSGGATMNVSLPAGCQASDIAVLFVSDYTTGGGAAPSGWTVLKSGSTGTAAYNVSWKALSSGDISAGLITVPAQGSTTPAEAVGIWVFRGVSVDAANAAVATGTNSVPSTTMTQAGYDLELAATGNTPPTALASSSGFTSANGNSNTSVAGGYEFYAAAGATTSRAFSGGGGTPVWTVAVPLLTGGFPSGSFTEIAVDKTPALRLSAQSLFR